MTSFGLQLPNFRFPGVTDDRLFDRIVEVARAAERSGFDSFWVMDHYHQIGVQGPPEEPMLEAYTTLAGVAARTSRIRLGAMVTGVTYRNPAFLAKTVTTLDIVSSGRAILGIGAAWNDEESRAYGYDWPSTTERFERLEDALRICRSMFTQARTTYRGTRHSVDGAYNVPQPVQPGGPKILIGGGGERKTLRLTAEYADMWNGFGDPVTVTHKLDVLAQHCADIGRDPAEIVKTRLGTIFVAETDEEATTQREAFKARRGVSDAELPASFTCGRPGQVVDELRALLGIGLDGLIFNMPPGSTPEQVERAGQLLTSTFGA